jgi:hypothetical protein
MDSGHLRNLGIEGYQRAIINIYGHPVNFLEHNTPLIKVVYTVAHNAIKQKLVIHHHNKPVILDKSSPAHGQWYVVDVLVGIPDLGAGLEHL